MDQRLLVFLIGCIGTRTALAVRSRFATDIELNILVVLAAAISISFFTLYTFGLRKTAPEAGGEVWWDNYRPVHGLNYALVAYFAYRKDRIVTSNILFIDVIIGLLARYLRF